MHVIVNSTSGIPFVGDGDSALEKVDNVLAPKRRSGSESLPTGKLGLSVTRRHLSLRSRLYQPSRRRRNHRVRDETVAVLVDKTMEGQGKGK